MCLKKAQMKVPQLSPTHTRAKILKFCKNEGAEIQCYDPIFILKCSPDLVSEGYRKYEDHEPLMIVEAHDEGVIKLHDNIQLDEWMNVGDPIGEIDDGEDDGDESSEWIWQAYSHDEEEES
jgi:pyruvate/2-oxoglutarate dehydrogenase complex dihydrolipoamide acyltransferase (E2) component